MTHAVVSRDEWLAARTEHLRREKEFSKLRDQLSAERRALPWVRVDKTYTFDTPDGPRTLAGLFDGRGQLIVYHFMLGPGWEEGCRSCSLVSDHFDGATVHLAHRDITLVAVSRAPLDEIEAFRRRMGWRFPWVSSNGSDFNHEHRVSFTEEDRAAGEVAALGHRRRPRRGSALLADRPLQYQIAASPRARASPPARHSHPHDADERPSQAAPSNGKVSLHAATRQAQLQEPSDRAGVGPTRTRASAR